VNTRRDHGGVIFIDLRDREGSPRWFFAPPLCNRKRWQAPSNHV